MNLMKSHANRFDLSDLVTESAEREAARSMGLVSLAIGLTELLAPKKLDQFIGTGNGENAGVFRVLGVREICHGIDILSHEDPGPGLWARVAGDVLDGMMVAAAAKKTGRPAGLLAAAAMVLPVVAADLFLAKRLSDHDQRRS